MNIEITDSEFDLVLSALVEGAVAARGDANLFAPFGDEDSVKRYEDYKATESAMLALHSRLSWLKLSRSDRA